MGPKNWLFAGSEGGAEAAAVIFSLVASCALHKVDPLAYLEDVLSRIADHPASRLGELTPAQWNAPA